MACTGIPRDSVGNTGNSHFLQRSNDDPYSISVQW